MARQVKQGITGLRDIIEQFFGTRILGNTENTVVKIYNLLFERWNNKKLLNLSDLCDRLLLRKLVLTVKKL